MTIVAGFIHSEGVLLCGDTLVGDATQSHYRSKILGRPFADGSALFAYAGDTTFCESAIERCLDALSRHNGKPRSTQQMSDAIRKVWGTAYRQSYGNGNTYNQIVAAIHSSLEQFTDLYHSDNQVFAKSTVTYECAGCGDQFCRYFLGAQSSGINRSSIYRSQVMREAVRAISRVKTAMPVAVGGNTIAANLNNSGRLGIYHQQECELIEMYTSLLQLPFNFVESSLGLFEHDSTIFRSALDGFADRANELQSAWLNAIQNRPSTMPTHIPREAGDLWNSFNGCHE